MRMRTVRWLAAAGLAAGLGAAPTASPAQEARTTPVSVVVSVEAKDGTEIPTVTKEDVKVFQGSAEDRVTEWTPLKGSQAGLQLYLLVDDSSDSSVALQFDEIRKFLGALPATTEVAIGYMRNGTVMTTQKLTTDHELAMKGLRLPLGGTNGGPSPYLSVSDLIKHWPAYSGRREILMVSEGIDWLQEGAVNSYLDAAIEDAQKAGVEVSAIYASGSGHLGHTYWRIYWGQYDLSRLTDETGGDFYWQGWYTPVTFQPYLQKFTNRLQNQYRLTFDARGKKGAVERISLETGVPNAQLVGPYDIYIPKE